MAVGSASIYDMTNEAKEEAPFVPEIGEASFAFLTSFSDIDFQADELDFLSSDPSGPQTPPQTTREPAFKSSDLKDRVQRLQAEKKLNNSSHNMRSSMAISNHGDDAITKTPKVSHNRSRSMGGSNHGSLHGRSLHGSIHKSSTHSVDRSVTKTPLHFRKSIAGESEARRLRRQALRDALEANSQAVSEMELPAPDLERSPTESTMYLKSPNVKRKTLRRVLTANGSLGSLSCHSSGGRSNLSNTLSLDSVDEVFKKSKKKKKHRKSDVLPMTMPLNGYDDDAQDNVSKKSSRSKKSKRTSSADKKSKKNKDNSEKKEKKEKKKRRSTSASRRTARDQIESREEPTAEPAEKGNGIGQEEAMEFSKFEFSEACFDVEMEKSSNLSPAAHDNSETDVTKATSATTQDIPEESSTQLGEEEVVELKTREQTENAEAQENHPRPSSSKERKAKGSSFRKKEESAELVGEEELEGRRAQPDETSEKTKKKKKRRSVSASKDLKRRGRLRQQEQEQESAELGDEGFGELNDGPNEKSEKEEKKKRRGASASKERKLRGRAQNKLNSGNDQQEGDDDDENTEKGDKKKKRGASSSKERTLRDRFRKRQGSQGSINDKQQEEHSSSPSGAVDKNMRRSSSASSLRERFRRRQTSQESFASATGQQNDKQQEKQPSSPSGAVDKNTRRSSSASSLRERYRRRQTSQASFASATGQQEPPAPPMSPPQRATTYSGSYDSPRAEPNAGDSPMSAGWASKRKTRNSVASSGRQSVSPSSSRRPISPRSTHSTRSRGFRSGGRRQSMSGVAPPLTPPQQVSRTGVSISPGRMKSRPSVAQRTGVDNSSFRSQQNGSFRSRRGSVGGGTGVNNSSFRSQQNGSFQSRRGSVGGGVPSQNNTNWQSAEFTNPESGKKATAAFDPFAAPKASKLDASVHDTPRGRKSPLHRRRLNAEQGPSPPVRGGRKPNNSKETTGTDDGGWGDQLKRSKDIRYQSPGPDLKGRYQSPGLHRPSSPVSRRRGPMSVPMSAPAAGKRPVRMRRSQVGDIGSIMREDSDGNIPRRSRSLKRNNRGGTRRSAESVDRRKNVDNAMSKLIDGATSHGPKEVPF